LELLGKTGVCGEKPVDARESQEKSTKLKLNLE